MAVRACVFIAAVALITLAQAVHAGLSGGYCGSYSFGMVTGKATFTDSTVSVSLNVFDNKYACNDKSYKLDAASGNIDIPDAASDSGCLGNLMKENGLTFKGTYNPGPNTVSLDVGVTTMEMDSC